MHCVSMEISLLWLVRTGMSPTVSLCKLWKMFTSNSTVIVACPCGDVSLCPMPVQLSNQTKIQDSHADFYCSLCIFPSAETWLLNSKTAMLCLGTFLWATILKVPPGRNPEQLESSLHSLFFSEEIQSWAVVKCHIFCLVIQFLTVGRQVWSSSLS